MKVKIPVSGTVGRSVSVETGATIGAQIGTDLRMPDGSLATAASLAAFIGQLPSSGGGGTQDHRLLNGLTLGDDHPQYLRKDTLTTRGDMYRRGIGAPERFGLGTTGQLLRSNGTDPVWATLSPVITLGTDLSGSVTLTDLASGTLNSTIVNNAVTDAKLRDSAALSVMGRASNTIGDPADIIAGNDGEVFRRSGTTLGFGTVETAGLTNNAVTNAKLAQMAQSRIKGRAEGAGTGDPVDLTPTEVASIIDGEAITWSANHLWLDNVNVQLGTGGDLNLYHDGTNSWARTTAGHLFASIGNSSTPVNLDATDSLSVLSERMTFAATTSANFDFTYYKGSYTTPTAPQNGDTLGSYRFRAHDGGSALRTVARMTAVANQNWTAGAAHGTRLDFANTPSGSTTATVRLRVDGDQVVTTDGAVGAPGQSFILDLDTGRYRIGANQMGDSAGGVLQFEIGSTYSDSKTQYRWTGVNSPAQITANTNDFTGAAGNFTVVRFSTDAARNITGATGGVAGRFALFINIGTQTAVFTNNDAASTAGNRFLNATGANKTVQAGGSLLYWYDGTSAAWRQIASIA